LEVQNSEAEGRDTLPCASG